MNVLLSVLAFILTIIILVGIHEYGHYIVARWFKVGVIKFSIGFGKSLYEYKHKKSGTIWAISLIPLGGYVKLIDERNYLQDIDNKNSEKIQQDNLPKSKAYPQYSFNQIHPLKKIAIILAGPCINFIAAIIFFAIVGVYGTKDAAPIIAAPIQGSILYQAGITNSISINKIEYGNNTYNINSFSDILWQMQNAQQLKQVVILQAQDRHKNNLIYKLDTNNIPTSINIYTLLQPAINGIQIIKINPNSLALKLGLQTGDEIIAIDNQAINIDMLSQKLKDIGKPFILQIKSKQVLKNFTVYPKGELLGVHLKANYQQIEVKYGVFESIKFGIQKTWQIIYATFSAITNIFSEKNGTDSLGGPVAISSIAKSSLIAGFDSFLQFLALISISLGVMNLLPLPVLDGGQALLTFFEYITNKAIPIKVALGLQKLGVALILIITFIAFKNDISKFF